MLSSQEALNLHRRMHGSYALPGEWEGETCVIAPASKRNCKIVPARDGYVMHVVHSEQPTDSRAWIRPYTISSMTHPDALLD